MLCLLLCPAFINAVWPCEKLYSRLRTLQTECAHEELMYISGILLRCAQCLVCSGARIATLPTHPVHRPAAFGSLSAAHVHAPEESQSWHLTVCEQNSVVACSAPAQELEQHFKGTWLPSDRPF